MPKYAVLFVDDEPFILRALSRLMRKEDLHILCATSPKEALAVLEKENIHLIVSDMRMPEMDGATLLAHVRAQYPRTMRMLLTGGNDMAIARDAINRAEVFRLITKPWNDEELKATIHQAIHQYELEDEVRDLHDLTTHQNKFLQQINHTLEQQVQLRTKQLEEKNRELRQAYIETIRALAQAVDAKDAYTRGHSERVGVYASKIAREMGFPEEFIEQVYLAGVLHDIGKIGVPDTIISKPARLEKHEMDVMKTHPEISAIILEPVSFLAAAIPGVRHHHEWFDGSSLGYPDGLAGNAIPFIARILLVADTVEAMTSDRPYRKALPFARVLQELRDYSGTQFDPACVDAFLRIAKRDGEAFIEVGSTFDIYAFIEGLG